MSDINNQICDAIGIIVDKKISQAKFDKTIQATIVAQGDKTKGEYKVKYLDSLFYAYDKSGKDYAVGTQVYILVPENDLSKVKTILGTADKTKDTQPIIISEGNKFEYLTDNLFIFSEENKEFGIKSWENSSISILYDGFTIDTDGLSYITKEGFDYFILKCNVRTNLQESQQSLGTYGIRIAISADLKENQQNQKTQNLELKFELDSTMMVGNPYSLVIPVEQIAGFNIANYTNIDIKDVSLFSYKFDPLNDGEEDKENNIFFTDLSLQCANKISTDNLNRNYLYVSVPNGQYLSTKDGKDSVVLKAIFQSKGQIIDPTKYSGLTYYWFKKNPLISVADKEKGKYCKINGINTEGWECLNTYDEKSNTFKAGGDTYTIDQNSFLSSQQEYRCIALFDNLAYSKTKIVYNKNPQYIISLTSNSGPIFYNNNGKPTLTCSCLKTEDNSSGVTISANYYWYATKIDGQRKRINESHYVYVSTESISINEYPEKAIIDCAVEKFDDKSFIGVETLELLNLKSDTTMLYNLTIENGSQMFKYNTLGISPIHASSTNSNVEPSEKEKEAVLQPLSFTLVNNKTGEEFTEGSSQKWILPPDDKTMFDFSGLKKIQDYDKEGYEGYKVYEGTSLEFSIKSEYDYTKTKNTIFLEVVKENQTYQARTNILFAKEGDNGTNGTDYQCQIVGIQGGQKISFNNGIPYYYYNKSDGDKFYYNQEAISNQLKLKVLKNAQEIEIDNSQITWSVLKSPFFRNGNNYTSTKDYPFILTVDNSGTIREDENYKSLSNIEDIANIIIIKAECSFEDANNHKLIYATQPIGIVLNNPDIYNNYVENGSGFYRVVYDTDGTNPSYANTDTNIFRISGPEKGYFYKWKIIGEQLYFQDAKETNKKEIKVIAKDPLLAENISNGITCEIYLIKDTDIITEENGEVLINGEYSSPTHQIIIPIHLSTNRFGHSEINGWDGNTVSIDQEGGVVLLPQIGAGFKNENNAFTGVLMGTSLLKDHDDSTTNKDSYLRETGLMGFHNGERSFFLKSDDGSATFGKNGSGQIKIIPTAENGKPQAVITGGAYSKNNGTGMEINLSAPSITYGNKKFSVNKDGILNCTDAIINGWFSAKSSYNEKGYNNSYNINFSKDKSEIVMSQTKNNNTNVTIIKPGYFKTGSDKENEDNSSYLKYNNGKMQLKGDFDCLFKNGNLDKGRVQFNSNIGIRMEYKTNISSDGEYKAFTLTQNSLAFGSYKRTLNPDSNSTIETIGGLDYELTSGLSYNYTSGLSIKGKITATSGVIGGWRINENYIASANDGLILYSDGRIQGKMNVNSSGSNERSLNDGLLIQTDEKGKAEFTPYGLATFKILPNEQTYTRQYYPQYNSWIWSENYNSLSEEKKAALQLKSRFHPAGAPEGVWVEVYSLIEYKNQSTIGVNYNDNSIGIVSKEEETPISFVLQGATSLASSIMKFSKRKQDNKETKTSTFSAKAAPNTTSQNKKSDPQYAELSFPYSETTNGKQQDYDGTRISAVKIVTGDVEIDKNAKAQMKTRSANSLVSAVNEILTPPNKVVYRDGNPSSGDSSITIDTLTEYWYNPNFQYDYNIKVKNKNSSDEQVLSLERKPIMDGDKIIHPGYVIDLEGF